MSSRRASSDSAIRSLIAMSTRLVYFATAVATVVLAVTAGHSVRKTAVITPVHAYVTPALRPMAFEPADAAFRSGNRFVGRAQGTTLALANSGATLTSKEASFQVRVKGANQSAVLAGVEPDRARSHYLIGNDPAKWRTNV